MTVALVVSDDIPARSSNGSAAHPYDPRMPTCNGCGRDTDSSDEHLIHRRVGEALLGTTQHVDTAEMRRELLTGYVRFDGAAGEVRRSDVRMDGVIQNLLCAECNSGWANELEAAAGANLFAFLHQGSALDLDIFLRWFLFFQVKAEMYYTRSAPLRSGPMLDLFSRIRDPRATISIRLYCGRVDADPTTWQFTFHRALPGGEVAAGFMLVTHTVIWFMPLDAMDPPIGLTQAREGLRLSNLPAIPPALLTGTIVPVGSVDALGEYVQQNDSLG